MKITLTIITIFITLIKLQAQENTDNLRFGLGSSFFNIDENFDDIFIFNNSSPIYLSLNKSHFRIESVTNISLLSQNEGTRFVRGSLRLSVEYTKDILKKMKIYFGPQYGINTNETHLINLHVGGEYFLHKNWSISNQIGLNFLFDNENQTFIQTNSSIVLRFYFNIPKK